MTNDGLCATATLGNSGSLMCSARMGKYDPLRDYLKRQKAHEFELTFVEIERKLGAMLPNSANHPQWWATVGDANATHVQREAWRAAGFEAFLIAGKDRVRFSRVDLDREPEGPSWR